MTTRNRGIAIAFSHPNRVRHIAGLSDGVTPCAWSSLWRTSAIFYRRATLPSFDARGDITSVQCIVDVGCHPHSGR
jgi:hypothetical protein